MATNDITNNIKVVPAVAPVVLTDNTPTTPITVDTLGFKSVSFAIVTGTLADADATFAVEVTGSDTDGSFTAVADGDLIELESEAGFDFGDDAVVRSIGYTGSKRYLQVTITPSGNSGNAPLAAVCLLGDPNHAPVTLNA